MLIQFWVDYTCIYICIYLKTVYSINKLKICLRNRILKHALLALSLYLWLGNNVDVSFFPSVQLYMHSPHQKDHIAKWTVYSSMIESVDQNGGNGRYRNTPSSNNRRKIDLHCMYYTMTSWGCSEHAANGKEAVCTLCEAPTGIVACCYGYDGHCCWLILGKCFRRCSI